MLKQLAPEARLGVAVSGGPDSLALLLLAVAARPGQVHAATVDHRLREGSAADGKLVVEVCAGLGVQHDILQVTVPAGASLQAQARAARYAALAQWAGDRSLATVATAHHADDQAETLLMRLARGSGLGGLSGVRESRPLAAGVRLIRPLLGWRKAELQHIVSDAGLEAVDDPANADPRHDRTQARLLLSETEWLDPARLARSAAALAQAEEALDFAVSHLASERLVIDGSRALMTVRDLPPELQRRLLMLALAGFPGARPSGPEFDRALATLRTGGTCTLAGVKLSGGEQWRLSPAPPRRS
jgi:tRNA(Ile)-lysidine synthase